MSISDKSQQGAAATSLYAQQEKIYPREVEGRFQYLRSAAVFILLGLYYLIPWLSWGGRQAVLFDLPARKFYILGLTFWPQDFFYLSWLLIIAALSLFFFTALAGRLWCGYACPQTVWTEVFIWMERWVEGDRRAQIKMAQSPWTRHKIWRKSLKQALWIGFSLFTGFTFVGYFTPINELALKISQWQLGPWETFWGLFYSFATYGNAGFLREQVCMYMCPYARFQSAMFDQDTLLIAYDKDRGEPRGKGKQRRQAQAGDCVDCSLCVQACPTGIDIRDGLQYQCIACAACIDACDQVMQHLDLPKGLIRYSTERVEQGGKQRILRLRVILYGVLLSLLIMGFALSITVRMPLAFDILRDRNALYHVVDEQHIENVYTLKVMNKSDSLQTYQLTVSGINNVKAQLMNKIIEVPPGQVESVPVRIRANRRDINLSKQAIAFTLSSHQRPDKAVTEKTLFFSPGK